MGTANFLFGIGSRATSPSVINWFVDIFLTVVCLGYLLFKNRTGEVVADLKNNRRPHFYR